MYYYSVLLQFRWTVFYTFEYTHTRACSITLNQFLYLTYPTFYNACLMPCRWRRSRTWSVGSLFGRWKGRCESSEVQARCWRGAWCRRSSWWFRRSSWCRRVTWGLARRRARLGARKWPRWTGRKYDIHSSSDARRVPVLHSAQWSRLLLLGELVLLYFYFIQRNYLLPRNLIDYAWLFSCIKIILLYC